MMNSFAPAATFSLSNNYGMADNIVARVVAITNDRANVTGFGKRAIVANPGCKLLLPNKEGNFELSNGCERGNLSLLRLSLLERKGVHAIEYRTGGFYIDLPVTSDHGYDYNARCEDKVSYTAHCLVSIRNEGAFLSNFALSQSNPAITVQMVQDALKKGAITLLGNDVDDMGHIMLHRLHALFNVLGLFLHRVPSITNYVNARAKRLRELQEEYEREARETLRQVTQADVDITLKIMETLPQLMASLACSSLEPAEIDRSMAKYESMIKENSETVRKAYARALDRKQAYLAEAEYRANYRENNRPDRIYRQEAACLPRGRDNRLGSGERFYDAHSFDENQYRDPHSRDQHVLYEPRRSYGPNQHDNPRGNNYRPYERQPQGYDQRRSNTSGYQGGYKHSGSSMAPYQGKSHQYARNNYQRPYNDHYRDDRSDLRPYNKYGPKYD